MWILAAKDSGGRERCWCGGRNNRWSYQPNEAAQFKTKEAAEETAELLREYCKGKGLALPELQAVRWPIDILPEEPDYVD